jgi:hypothetical protein
MDRITRRLLTITLVITANFSIFGQCDEDYIATTEDSTGCTIVEMSPQQFAEFYKARKNLNTIKEEIPDVQASIDSLEAVNDSIASSFQAEIDTMASRHTIMMNDLDDCVSVGTELEIENLQLYNQYEAEKKKRKWFVAGGGAGVIIVRGLVKLIFGL